MQQNDPTELLEIFDAAGRPTGQAKPRAAVHLDGDWHQAFHCWIIQPGRRIVLQRRSLTKDTYAGCWDAAAAGHWRFGETPDQAAREIAEELGLDVSFDQLEYRGRERAIARFDNGLIDREHHQVYVLRSEVPLVRYRPDPTEVVGLAAFEAGDLVRLAASRLEAVASVEAVAVSPSGALEHGSVTLTRADLVPYSAARLRRLLGRPRLA